MSCSGRSWRARRSTFGTSATEGWCCAGRADGRPELRWPARATSTATDWTMCSSARPASKGASSNPRGPTWSSAGGVRERSSCRHWGTLESRCAGSATRCCCPITSARRWRHSVTSTMTGSPTSESSPAARRRPRTDDRTSGPVAPTSSSVATGAARFRWRISGTPGSVSASRGRCTGSARQVIGTRTVVRTLR